MKKYYDMSAIYLTDILPFIFEQGKKSKDLSHRQNIFEGVLDFFREAMLRFPYHKKKELMKKHQASVMSIIW